MTTTKALTIKGLFDQENVKNKFEEILGDNKRSKAFIVSVLQIVNQSDALVKCDPKTVFGAAVMAATLDLPINPQLGFSHIVPYGKKASLIIGWRGYVQLAQRTGSFKTISVTTIYEGELIERNPLIGFKFDFDARTSEKVTGYAAYFELLNGFEKTLYWTHAQMEVFAKKYSATYKKGGGVWKSDFEAMAQKTILKQLLSKYAPLSIEMQNAVMIDQGTIGDTITEDIEYVDQDTGEVVVVKETVTPPKAKTTTPKGEEVTSPKEKKPPTTKANSKKVAAKNEETPPDTKTEATELPGDKEAKPTSKEEETTPKEEGETAPSTKEKKKLQALTPKHKSWGNAVKALSTGKTSMKKIKEMATLTEKDELALFAEAGDLSELRAQKEEKND